MFEHNRRRFIEACEGALVVVAGHEPMQLSADMAAPFLQESNFWWLTGINEPGWKAVIDCVRGKVILVSPAMSDTRRTFDGGMNDTAALAASGADSVIPAEELERELMQLARRHTLVLTVENKTEDDTCANPAQARLARQLARVFTSVETCNKQLAELRAIKQPHEITLIKRAVALTTEAFRHVHDNWPAYKYEYEVEADFTHMFRRHGAEHAYAPIVAGGLRACTLHYDKNEARITKRDMVVIDIGARVGGYAADITRTYCQAPSAHASRLHQAVTEAHSKIIGLLRPDLLVSEYITEVDRIMKEALRQVGLPDAPEEYRRYFPHSVSHGLGADVHDSLGTPRYFKPGMVLTVEPGLYVPEWSCGVRIEDDILITGTGHENLSRGLSTAI